MLADNIKRLRKENDMSQSVLARKLNVHQTAVSQWEHGRTRPDQELLGPLAAIFNVSVDTLLGKSGRESRPAGIFHVPVFGAIPAGVPLAAIEEIEDYEELQAIAGRSEKDFFALRISGNSMLPAYMDGDTVLFLAQNTCESGQDCAVIVNGCDATFKRVRRSPQGITLQPLNPSFAPISFTNYEIETLPVRIIGVACEIRRKISLP